MIGAEAVPESVPERMKVVVRQYVPLRKNTVTPPLGSGRESVRILSRAFSSVRKGDPIDPSPASEPVGEM